LHLGFGADGHTASLFPGSSALDETSRLVVATGDELHPWPRISMTFPGVARASTVLVTVAGKEKRDAFMQLCAGAPLPAARLAARDEVLWLVEGTIVA
jgi:6-phosphogluconolactonase